MAGEFHPREPMYERGEVVAGKYEIERRIGAGGMGVVLAVRHRELGELYALKLMLPAAAGSSAARERFAREAKAAAKLKSEHVARAIDFGFLPDDGPPYMVLELLSGQNLAERLAEVGPLDPHEVARLMLHACEALREAHEHGIVHRDLKPSNLFLTRRPNGSECLKVLDFGIAKTVATDASALTKTATTMGSPFYMSPEQMRSAKSADQRSDVWSLGVTMFELLTGRVPFMGESVTEVAILVIEAAVPRPSTYRSDLPAELERVVMRCLQKDPARRYASVDELGLELATFTGEPWVARAGTTLSEPSSGNLEEAAFARTEPSDGPTPSDSSTPSGLGAGLGAREASGASSKGKELPATVFGQPLEAAVGGASAAAETASGAARSIAPSAPRRTSLLVGGAVVALGGLAVWLGVSAGGAPQPTASNTTEATSSAGRIDLELKNADIDNVRRLLADASATPTAAPDTGGLDLREGGKEGDIAKAILAVVDAHKTEKQQCYDMARASIPDLKGKFDIHFVIRADGTTKGLRIDGDDIPAAVKNCFIGVFSQMSFPAPADGKEIEATFPIQFTPSPRPVQAKKPAAPVQQQEQAPSFNVSKGANNANMPNVSKGSYNNLPSTPGTLQ